MSTLANRNELILEFLDQQAPVVDARCVSDRLVVDPEVEPLFAQDSFTDAEQTLLSDRTSRYIDACRSR